MFCTKRFYAEVINGIESVAYSRDYHAIITQSLESYEEELKSLHHLLWRSVEGILASLSTETTDTNHFNKVNTSGTPIVFFDRVIDNINTHSVVSDGSSDVYD